MNDKYNRAQFEQYAESQGLRDFEYDQDDASRYRNPFTQREWNYWVAALECVAQAARATPAQPMPSPSSVGAAIRALEVGTSGSKGYVKAFCHGAAVMRDAAAELAEQQGSEDTILLDWFDQQRTAYGFEGVQEGNEWLMNGPFATLRQALRECMAAAPQDWQKSETDHG